MNKVRPCASCGRDISRRHYHARLCFDCVKSRQTDRVAKSAHSAVASAVKRGELPDPKTMQCHDCGTRAMDYDHRDYSQPLKVQAVCRSCNKKRGPAIGSPAYTEACA